jgi:hypothetical protein
MAQEPKVEKTEYQVVVDPTKTVPIVASTVSVSQVPGYSLLFLSFYSGSDAISEVAHGEAKRYTPHLVHVGTFAINLQHATFLYKALKDFLEKSGVNPEEVKDADSAQD